MPAKNVVPDDNPVRKARADLLTLKAEFEARKAREWEDVQARARIALEDAVWNARHVEGRSVYEIAQMYGTTNRNTIYDLLRSAEAARGTARAAVADEGAPAQPYTFEPHDDGWLVTQTATGYQAVVTREGRPVRSLDAGALALALYDRDHEAWRYAPKN